MKIYHSALSLSKDIINPFKGRKIGLLRSFYPKPDSIKPEYCSNLFLDSGAFSAFRKNISLDVHSYASYLEKEGHLWEVVANLDVIGNPIESIKNQKYLTDLKLNVIPTFHHGEDFKYLHKMMDEFSYIALGGMVFKNKWLRGWLDACWKDLKNYKGKVHGFGLTNFDLMARYPWESVDSTTASRTGRIGVILSPWGQLDISKGLKAYVHAHITTPKKIEKVMEWLDSLYPEMFSSFDEISNRTKEASQLRCIINVLYLESLIKTTEK